MLEIAAPAGQTSSVWHMRVDWHEPWQYMDVKCRTPLICNITEAVKLEYCHPSVRTESKAILERSSVARAQDDVIVGRR